MDPAIGERVRTVFDNVPAVVAVYVFGSVARGSDGPASDIDVAVLMDETPPSTLMGPRLTLEGRLEQALERPLDLVILNTASADLVHRVIRDGDLLIDRDRVRRIRFEVANRNEYFDLQPVRDAYRRLGRAAIGLSSMSDPALVGKKLAQIETCLSELRRLARPAAPDSDIRERRFVEHTLQMAIQAALDVASHIVSDQRLGEPQTNRDLFDLLSKAGWLAPGQAQLLKNMAGFRNILVHGYDDVDLGIVRSILASHLDDLATFATTIRQRL
jgi:uncharacterized protein YutE (UPF0331/DUF86 family)/predicted nucleotidyltransferase